MVKNKTKKEKNFCFICNKKLTELNKSKEDIFPLWMQKEFNLYNQKITLLNGSTIPYCKLKIDCCVKHNNENLSYIENIISNGYKKGFSSFKKIKEEYIVLWLTKIVYACLIKETKLYTDLKLKNKKIISKKIIKNLNLLKLLIVGFRKKLYLEGPIKPWSLYLVKTRKYTQKTKNFDYLDNIISNSVAIRMGDIGIILFLFDNSAHKTYYPKVPIKFKTNIFSREQFRETVAFMFYKGTLLDRVPWYISFQNKKMIKIAALPIEGMSSKPIYNEWKEKDYQIMRSSYTKK